MRFVLMLTQIFFKVVRMIAAIITVATHFYNVETLPNHKGTTKTTKLEMPSTTLLACKGLHPIIGGWNLHDCLVSKHAGNTKGKTW